MDSGFDFHDVLSIRSAVVDVLIALFFSANEHRLDVAYHGTITNNVFVVKN